MNQKTIAVTGAAGFIGFSYVNKLLESGYRVIAIDSLNPSYGGNLSRIRWQLLKKTSKLIKFEIDLAKISVENLSNILSNADSIFHLAAYPGVRLGEINQEAYQLNNVEVFRKLLDATINLRLDKLLFASSSSVYGNNESNQPSPESSATGNNLKSFYASTKWQNELDAQDFSQKVDFPIVALRFFTVFGPFGRPDMAYWNFAKKILNGEKIDLYGKNGGERNFTFINDVIDILIKINAAKIDTNIRVLNVASGSPISTLDFALHLYKALGVTNQGFNFIDRPNVDVEKTWADLTNLKNLIGKIPYTPTISGVQEFVRWFNLQEVSLQKYE